MPSQIDEEKMRNSTMANQPFEMHKPPLKHLPHLEFPKLLYLWPKDKTMAPGTMTAMATNPEEEKAFLAKGYRNVPHKQEFEEELPEGFEADIAEEKRGPGRPPKVVD